MTFDAILLEKIKNLKLVVTDVDGVLTDGSLYYTENGLVMKKFNVKDGMGVKLLREAGLKTGMISTDTSKFMRLRAERLRMDYIYLGVWEKQVTLREICDDMNITMAEAAFIGDDVNDLGVMKEAGFTACPADAVDEIIEISNYKCKNNGGRGAYRELVNLILSIKKEY
ncbi:MAG: hypothetical protein SCALA702_05140 [Melioribacteraceae bacterium]|nr:MAG: hypothetical protein SCALA702_05140 [Melioribacteraceae bacterium]